MGIFSVAIDELEEGISAVMKQVDVTEQLKNAMTNAVSTLVGPIWEGDGARAFEAEISSEVIAKLDEILGFSQTFIQGIRKVIEILRMLDSLLPF